ncbi:rab effector Noc2 isoform X2 [Ornithorhynchus anatinus]|uniref:rab effector Noc2 isoform X2 n=1 Tax=Ornithorhynchus anatinus TaxID=9258 RepID=UPI00028F41EB|nr:rab effector Noc2 isoform X2 [Ornithorhynchus anatinus]
MQEELLLQKPSLKNISGCPLEKIMSPQERLSGRQAPTAMADTIFGNGSDQWVCPNDRQLALRAKLQSGWSVHTYQTDKQRKSQSLNPAELSTILEVIQRAEKLDVIEQHRIGGLVERLENMRKNVMGNGLSQCLLCGEPLGLLGGTAVFCRDCKKKVCTKCGIETSGGQKRPLWLCKICSEQREVWKRSGAWFYRGLPKYILPLKTAGRTHEAHLRPLQVELPPYQTTKSPLASRSYTWARGKVVSSDSESDSEPSSSSPDDKRSSRRNKDSKSDTPHGESGLNVKTPRAAGSGASGAAYPESRTGRAGPEPGGGHGAADGGTGDPQGHASDRDGGRKAPGKRRPQTGPSC